MFFLFSFLQSAHAALGVYESYHQSNKSNFDAWERQGKPMAVYQVSDTNDLKSINEIAESLSMLSCLIRDAGRTQIPRGSTTVLALGPDESSKIDHLTKHLLTYS